MKIEIKEQTHERLAKLAVGFVTEDDVINMLIDSYSPPSPAKNSKRKITMEHIQKGYELAKLVHAGNLHQNQVVDELVDMGMNETSAVFYIDVIKSMLDGETYKRDMSSEAIDFCLTKIYGEYGKDGLKKAIQAVKGNQDYCISGGYPKNGKITKLISKHEQKL